MAQCRTACHDDGRMVYEVRDLHGIRQQLERLISLRFFEPLSAEEEALYQELAEREAHLLTIV